MMMFNVIWMRQWGVQNICGNYTDSHYIFLKPELFLTDLEYFMGFWQKFKIYF